MNHTPFESLKVVELAGVLAGPSVGMFFAELGASVIKFENKKSGGDVTRSWKLPVENKSQTVSAYFSSINYKKNYRFVDFKDADDLNLVYQEIANCDIVIVNFKKGDAQKLGLSYEDVKRIQPAIIYAEISGFGAESDRVAYDLILQAESGFMAMNGTPDSGPVKMPVALIDILAGHQLKEGILVALMQRAQTNKGCQVHVSLLDSALASLANQACNWLMCGHIPERIGSKHPNIAPYGELFTTSDGKLITLAIGSDIQFQKLCQVLELNELVLDNHYATNQSRVINRGALEKMLGEKIKFYSSNALLSKLHAQFIPAAAVQSLNEVLEKESSKSLIREEIIDGVKTRRITGTVFKITA